MIKNMSGFVFLCAGSEKILEWFVVDDRSLTPRFTKEEMTAMQTQWANQREESKKMRPIPRNTDCCQWVFLWGWATNMVITEILPVTSH